MEDQHRVAVVEQSVAAEWDLAAATLLCRRTHDGHASPDTGVGERTRERDARTRGRRRDQVVPACVSETAQRVVLADKRDVGARVAMPRNECGRHSRGHAFDSKSVLLDDTAQEARRFDLLEADLSKGMYGTRGADQLVRRS